ncbi:hypothetical protein PUN28_000448 [Cardiocondyla obscurior]|uniref:Uncharacterized protein n=1 Tax=Cardiocondyla obscurior TaxID=286306 RepID=A0AAW2GZG6_9HYME
MSPSPRLTFACKNEMNCSRFRSREPERCAVASRFPENFRCEYGGVNEWMLQVYCTVVRNDAVGIHPGERDSSRRHNFAMYSVGYLRTARSPFVAIKGTRYARACAARRSLSSVRVNHP